MNDVLRPKQRPQELLATLSKLRIEIETGRVFGLSGNEYLHKVDGRVKCSVYCAELYQTFCLSRYHIIWWKAKGEWPTQLVDHIDEVCDHDWIDNLQYLTPGQNSTKHFTRRSEQWLRSEAGNSTPWLPELELVPLEELTPQLVKPSGPYGTPWLKR